jgi:hypothetical protein
MHFANFLQFSYWFSIPLFESRATHIVLWAVTGVILALAIVLVIIKSRTKDGLQSRILTRFSDLAFFFSLLGMLLTFLREQMVPLFSWRLWSVILLLISLVWLWRIIKYVRVRVPEIHKERAERERREKYLPQRKNA